jgi:phenylacetate-CoA ligase
LDIKMAIAGYLPRFRKAYQSFAELELRENWTRAQIEAFQLERLNDVWSHAVVYVPYYRRLSEVKSLPDRFKSLEEYSSTVPLLDKDLVRANPTDFFSDCPQAGAWHRTSGSTSSPLKAFRSHEAHQEMLRASYRYYRMWGHDIFDPMVFLWSTTTSRSRGLEGVVAGCREFAEDKLRNRLRLSADSLGDEQLRDYLSRIARFRPSAIYAYSRAAFLLAIEAIKQGFTCPSLKVVNISAEPATQMMIATIEKAFGVPCIVQYGCVEFGFVAGEWPDRTLRVREDITYLETLPREDGLLDVALTTLNNPSFPLLRYDIGDLCERPIELPDRGFGIMGDVSGRCGDLLYTKSRECIHPTAFDEVFEVMFLTFVKRFQIRQRADYSLAVLVELHDSQRLPDTTRMLHALSVRACGLPVELQIVEEILPTAAGKHRNVISEVQV